MSEFASALPAISDAPGNASWTRAVVALYAARQAGSPNWDSVFRQAGLHRYGLTPVERRGLVGPLKAASARAGRVMPNGVIAVVFGVARRTVCRDVREILAERARLAGPRVVPADVFVRAVRSRLSDFEGAVRGVLDESTARRVVLEEQGAAARAARHEAAGLVAETIARLERAASDLVGLDAPYREGLS